MGGSIRRRKNNLVFLHLILLLQAGKMIAMGGNPFPFCIFISLSRTRDLTRDARSSRPDIKTQREIANGDIRLFLVL